MTQMDALVARMVEKQVERMVLENDRPGLLIRGTQQVNGPTLSGPQLLHMVREVLPDSLQTQFDSAGPFQFQHPAPAGLVQISVLRTAQGIRLAINRIATPQNDPPGPGTPPLLPNSITTTLKKTFPVGHGTRSVAFSPDGQTVATGSFDNKVRLWDIASGLVRQELNHGGVPIVTGGISSLSFSPDGRALASGGGTALKVWNTLTGKTRWVDKGSLQDFCCVVCSPDGKYVANGTAQGFINIRSLVDGKPQHKVRKVFGLEVGTFTGTVALTLVAFSADSQTLVSARNRELKLWQCPSAELIKEASEGSAGLLGAATCVALSPDGQTIASGYTSTGEDKVTLWDADTLRQRSLQTGGRGVLSLAFSPDSRLLVTGAADGEVCLYSTTSGQLLRSLTKHDGQVHAVVFSPDGQFLASGSQDSTVRLWKLNY